MGKLMATSTTVTIDKRRTTQQVKDEFIRGDDNSKVMLGSVIVS
jgi:hypothetical protein